MTDSPEDEAALDADARAYHADDLVKRLRDWSEYDEGKINDAREEAADRIEQLESALREKDNIAYVIDSHGISHGSFTIVYRAALGEKKDV